MKNILYFYFQFICSPHFWLKVVFRPEYWQSSPAGGDRAQACGERVVLSESTRRRTGCLWRFWSGGYGCLLVWLFCLTFLPAFHSSPFPPSLSISNIPLCPLALHPLHSRSLFDEVRDVHRTVMQIRRDGSSWTIKFTLSYPFDILFSSPRSKPHTRFTPALFD